MRRIISAMLSIMCLVSSYATDANDSNGIKGITMSINPERIHRSGDVVSFKLVLQNNTTKDENGIYVNLIHAAGKSKASIDGEIHPVTGDNRNIDLPVGEAVSITAEIASVPPTAEHITSIIIAGRAPNSSKATRKDPYGDYEYRFKDIQLPSFPESNRPGCVFYDNEIQLHVGEISTNGNNLVIDFTLTNNGRKDYSIYANNFGKGVARTIDGDEYQAITEFPEILPVGEVVKGHIEIIDGANECFATVRQQFRLSQNGDSWQPGLLLRNISK